MPGPDKRRVIIRWRDAEQSAAYKMSPVTARRAGRMSRFRFVIVILVTLLAVTAAQALADKRVALIVANGDYKGAPLENPTTDANLVAASLTTIGFAVKVVKNADLDAFDSAVNTFANTAKGADVALFYFAGHGFTVNDGIKSVRVLMSTSANVTSSSERVLL